MNKTTYLPLIISTAAASFMVNLDTYIINVSIPAIAADFLVDKADISWVVMSYNLLVVSLLLICGKLADRIGLKKLFLFGFLIFTASSLFCALSQNLGQLVASRVLQGIGASVLYALPQAIIGKFLPKEERGMGFGYSASAAALGIMFGAPVGGMITGILSWHWIFLINIPVGIGIILLILINGDLFQENQQEKVNSAFDIKGSLLSFFAVLGLTFWLNRLNSLGFENAILNIIFLISLILTVWFILHCLKEKNPLLDLKLFCNKYFTYGNIAMFLISAFLAGNNFIMPFYLAEVKHFSEFQTGLLFIVYSASYMAFSMFYGKILSKRVNSAKVSSFAGILSALSILMFVFTLSNNGSGFVILYFILLGMSFSFFITSNNNFIMCQAREDNAGAVAGLHRMTGRFGMLFGVVVFEFLYSFADKMNADGYIYTYLAGMIICLFAGLLSILCISDKKS